MNCQDTVGESQKIVTRGQQTTATLAETPSGKIKELQQLRGWWWWWWGDRYYTTLRSTFSESACWSSRWWRGGGGSDGRIVEKGGKGVTGEGGTTKKILTRCLEKTQPAGYRAALRRHGIDMQPGKHRWAAFVGLIYRMFESAGGYSVKGVAFCKRQV